MRYLLVILFILMAQNVYATCSDDQIDINSASKEELTEIIYIGEVRAEELIELRPFDSIDGLIEIKGIGEVYLSRIKEQGLVCIDGIEEENEKEEKEEIEELEEVEKAEEAENNFEEIKEDNIQKRTELEIIKLNSQTIKSEDNKEEELEESDKTNYAIYSFVFFCVLLGFLFVIRKIKFRKNEFD